MARRSWKRRAVIWGGGLVSAFLLVTTLVHLPAVQRMMGWTHPDGTGACPFGYDGAPGGTVATARPRVGPLAPARPALGFTLAVTTRADVQTWAAANQVSCTERRRGRELECASVPAGLLAGHGAQLAGTTTWFELDAQSVLAGIKTVRRTTAAAPVALAFAATAASLTASTGAPTTAEGSAATDDLARGAFRQAMVEHRFGDYRAQIRATNMGDGFVLTESYTAL